MASKDEVLLPCPFCAGTVEMGFYHPDMGPSSCFVKCWCGARGTEHQYHHGDHKEAITKARAAWNRRAGETRCSTDAEDAAKWRALRNCARMTAMGSAGLGPEKAADDYAHVTLNFWTGGKYDSPGPPWARDWLDTFVLKALRATKDSAPHYPDAANVMCTCGKWFGEHPIEPPWWPCMLKTPSVKTTTSLVHQPAGPGMNYCKHHPNGRTMPCEECT